MAVYMTVIVIAGFWPTYFGHYLFGQELVENGIVEISWKTHLHTIVFMSWMVILISQTVLVARNKTETHMKLGKFGVGLGILVVLLGLYMSYYMTDVRLTNAEMEWSDVSLDGFIFAVLLHFTFVNMYEFVILLVLGVYYRTKPEAHKRYMLFATIALMSAAASRLYFLGHGITTIVVIASAVLPIWIYDLYKDKKIHPATLVGTFVTGLYLIYYI